MKQRILILCTANICRSPLAQGLLQSLLPTAMVESAGVHAVDGRPVDSVIATLLRERGISLDHHLSRRVTADMLASAGLVLVMESSHKQMIEKMAPGARGKVFYMDLDKDVPDPYKKPLPVYQAVAGQIAQCCADWARKIALL